MGNVYKRQIAFDLSQEELKKHYPRSKFAMSPKYYNEAYADIKRFMKKHGFEHRQGSVYISKDKLSNADINILVGKLAKELPWLSKCATAFDVTSIGTQHSLKKVLENVAREFELEKVQTAKTKEPTQMSMSDWEAQIRKEKSRNTGNNVDSHEKNKGSHKREVR